ncbi:MAG: cell division ATPase MinD [Candidatus Nanoarchaeia archaeon]|nr:cell division ATPase MinD [Candidatus Nanoarchaeia archaeon]
MTKIIGVLAGKGGTGKTTTSVNLGAALTYFGKDVIIVDANLTTPNVGLHLGVPVGAKHLHHVLQGKHEIKDAVYPHHSGIRIVPGSLSINDLHATDSDKLKRAVKQLKKLKPDFIIVDGAAGLGREALNGILASEELLIVTNPEMPAIADALKTIKLAEKFDRRVAGIVLTKTIDNNLDISAKKTEEILETPIIAVIPHDKAVRESLTRKDAAVFTHPKSRAAVGYKKLAASLIGHPYEEEMETAEGFFTELLKKFGLK